jgi:hypothetical protein
MNVNDCEGGIDDEIEIEGASLTWLTRTMLPFDGDIEAKLMERSMLGAKLAGMMFDGRRLALRSDSINMFAAIVLSRVLSLDQPPYTYFRSYIMYCARHSVVANFLSFL